MMLTREEEFEDAKFFGMLALESLDYNSNEIIECSNNLCNNQYPIIN